jgi:DnaK suppressor protein
MSASINVDRRLTASPHLADHQLGLLRDHLDDALAEHRRQLEQNNALFDSIDGATGDDHSGQYRELARVAAERAQEAIDEVQAALARLHDGTFGSCQMCGQPIPFERLEVIPEVRHCVACPPPVSRMGH